MPPARYVADENWFDDTGIRNNDEVLWRVIQREYIKPHPYIPGQFIASGQAYRTAEISVYLASQTTIEAVLSNHPDDSLGAVTVGFVRNQLGLIVVRDPHDDNPDTAHVLIGRRDHISISKGTARDLANEATWVVLRPPVGNA